MLKKEYIGDGVYVGFDGFNVILTTENGIKTTNEIYLEPRVRRSLMQYIEKLDNPQVPNTEIIVVDEPLERGRDA